MRLSILGGGIGSPAGSCHKAAISIDRIHEIDSGIFSRNNIKNQKSIKLWNPESKEIFKNIKDLSKRPNIDCLSIITPTPDHLRNILDSKSYFKNIICEKALCCNLEESLILKKELSNNNLFVIYNYTGYPMVRIAKKLIKDLEIGEILEIHVKMPQRSFIKKTSISSNEKNGPQSWRLVDGKIPNLDLDLGTHLHNIVEYLTENYISEVIGQQKISKKYKVVETSHYLFNTNTKAIGTMIHGKSNLKEDNGLHVEIVGGKGTISWKQTNPEELILTNEKATHILTRANFDSEGLSKYERMKPGHPGGFIEAFANYYNSINNFLQKKEDKDNIFGISSSIRGLSFLESANKSIKSKKWEKVKDF